MPLLLPWESHQNPSVCIEFFNTHSPIQSSTNSQSLGHSHVMAPQVRSAEGAWAVANKVLHKAAMRLRIEKFYTGSMAVTLRYQLTREQAEQRKSKHHYSRIKQTGWGMEARFHQCQHTLSLLGIMHKVWEKRPDREEFQRGLRRLVFDSHSVRCGVRWFGLCHPRGCA